MKELLWEGVDYVLFKLISDAFNFIGNEYLEALGQILLRVILQKT